MYTYKKRISELVEDERWAGFYRMPSLGKHSLEYRLDLPDCAGRADFCYEFGDKGRLFIEDDDAPRALNNLVKYWRWSRQKGNEALNPIVLVHIIGSRTSIYVEHCKFLKDRVEQDLKNHDFHYKILTIAGDAWETPERWIDELEVILQSVRQDFP